MPFPAELDSIILLEVYEKPHFAQNKKSLFYSEMGLLI